MSERRTLSDRGLDIEAVRLALMHERRVFVGFLAAVMLAAVIATALTPRQYEAVSLIQLLPRAGQEVEVDAVVKHDDGGYLERRDRARTQIQIILSRTIREEVIRRYVALGHTDLPQTDAAIEGLRNKMSATPREDTELVEIGVTHGDPQAAAVLANLVSDVYAESNLTMRTDAAREAQVWIGGQSAGYRATLEAASAKVMEFKQRNNVVDIDEKVDGVSTRLTALQDAASDATTRRVLLESKLGEHRRLLARGANDVLAGMFEDPALDAIARERATVITETAEVLARYGGSHPEHKNAQERIKRIDELIATEVRRNVNGEQSQVETLRRQEQQIAEELVTVKEELLDKQRLRAEYAVLKQEEDRARALFSSLGERGAEVDLQASTRLNDVRLVDRAVPPTRASKPNWALNLAAAFAVGVAGGLAIALLRNRISDTILSSTDIGRYVDAPLLGIVPSLAETVAPEARDLYSVQHPRSLAAEAFRGIRSVLLVGQPKSRSRRYIVTSCLEAEGKSLVSIGLAASFAQLGQRVLLIDGDLRLPRLHVALGLAQIPGLGDSVLDPADPQRFAVRTDVPRLHFLSCGTEIEFPNEFLASDEVNRVLAALGANFDVLVIDTPPSALVADAMALAKHADGVILVARRGRVARNLVIRTVAQLRQMGGDVLGVILNDVPRNTMAYGSKYYDERATRS